MTYCSAQATGPEGPTHEKCPKQATGRRESRPAASVLVCSQQLEAGTPNEPNNGVTAWHKGVVGGNLDPNSLSASMLHKKPQYPMFQRSLCRLAGV